jgi:hypothetical protein
MAIGSIPGEKEARDTWDLVTSELRRIQQTSTTEKAA